MTNSFQSFNCLNLKTLLGVGIPISTFLIGTTLGHLATIEERQSLARQLLLQAEVIKYKKLIDDYFIKENETFAKVLISDLSKFCDK